MNQNQGAMSSGFLMSLQQQAAKMYNAAYNGPIPFHTYRYNLKGSEIIYDVDYSTDTIVVHIKIGGMHKTCEVNKNDVILDYSITDIIKKCNYIFELPLEDMPLYINDGLTICQEIAKWRMNPPTDKLRDQP